MSENNPILGLGSEALFGDNQDAGKKAEEVLREGLAGEEILFKDIDSGRDVEASEILDEKPSNKNEIVVVRKPDAVDGVVEDEEEKNETKSGFDKVRDRLESLGNKFVREDAGRVRLIIESLKKDGLNFDTPEVKNIEYFGDDVKKAGSGINRRIDISTATSAVEDNTGAVGTKFDTVDKAKTYLRKIGVKFEVGGVVNDEPVIDADQSDVPDDSPIPEPEVETELQKKLRFLKSDNPTARAIAENIGGYPGSGLSWEKIRNLDRVALESFCSRLIVYLGGEPVGDLETDMKLSQNLYFRTILSENGEASLKLRGSIEIQRKMLGDTYNENSRLASIRKQGDSGIVKISQEIDSATDIFKLDVEARTRLKDWIMGIEVSNNDKSDVGIIVKVLGKTYLESDIIGGNKNIEISKENNQELLRQVVKIHDVAVTMDSPTFKPENMPAERLSTVDEAMIAMLTIKRGGVSLVPKVVEVFDRTMREEYRIVKKEIDIDNTEIINKVMLRLRNQNLFSSEEEIKVFVKMGRDICRITGVDAQYGYPVEVEKGKSSGLALSVKGAFLRGLLNFNKALVTYGTDERLTGGIELGIVPFWNKLRKIEDVESAGITASDIDSVVQSKMLGQENFLGWFGTLKGFVEAKNAESDFMNGKPPKLDDFFEKVVPAYHGYMKYTPDKEREYLRKRFAGCITYFSKQVGGLDLVREVAKKTFIPGNVFDGKSVFGSLKEMANFFKKQGSIISTQGVTVKSKNDAARDAGQRGDILGVIKSIFNPK